ncbi:MAG: hypothetical protein WCL02_08935 [bacterium]
MNENSTHHIFAQKEKSKYNVHIQENKTELERKHHDALHSLFENKHPKEQLLKIVQINKAVIDIDIVNMLTEILQLPEDEFYIPEIFNKKYQQRENKK